MFIIATQARPCMPQLNTSSLFQLEGRLILEHEHRLFL